VTGDTVPDPSAPAPPADYQLLLPEGWFRLDIDPERRERSVDALVERQFRGVDNAPQIKRQLRQEMLAQATTAFEQGGIELYLSLQQAGPFTIPASLLIGLGLPPHGGRLPSLHALADELAADTRGKREVTVVELPAGEALRVREESTPSPGAEDHFLPSVSLDFQVSVPHAQALLLLTFSTPLIQIADAMVELFDAVAGSLSWKGE